MDRPPPLRARVRPLVPLVDGCGDTRALCALALSGLGFDLLSAADSESAYGRARTLLPDIVVTELTLRSGDGWDLIQRLKRDASTQSIPVAVLTADDVLSARERAAQEGCAAFWVKPCNADQLARRVRKALQSQASATP